MSRLIRLLKSARNSIYENVYPSRININNRNTIFSFSFDDVPISAMRVGARILESHSAPGTFYVAMGMSDVETNSCQREYLNDEDLILLQNKGHDVQCHTYNHLSAKRNSPKVLLEDCEKNFTRLRKVLKGKRMDHFAFPFGEVSLRAKKVLNKRYKTMRSVEHGINVGITDASHLRGVSLCNIDFDRARINKAIQAALDKNAWVIFFTHEVCDSPSDWGTNTNDFKWVVEQCAMSHGVILSVSAAYNEIIE